MRPYRLTDFEIKKNYQNASRFNEVYSGNNLLQIKNVHMQFISISINQ